MSDLSRNAALVERARRVVPGAMWGHQNAARLPPGYPQYFSRGEGCTLWDVDGNAYVDFMCAWGPIILGHRHPEVEAAAQAQAAKGDCLNGPGEVMVELAELFVDTIAAADWVQFKKNGNDATTSAVVIAARRDAPAQNPRGEGRLSRLRTLVLALPAGRHRRGPRPYPDLRLQRHREPLSRREAARGDLAGVIVSAFRHDLGIDQELPSAAFAQAVRAVCDDAEAALILDDVRAGLRLHAAGSWEVHGVRPDLSSWSKAISNGYALSALTGNDRFRAAAAEVFSTGSFWTTSIAMAASLATIRTLLRDDGIGHMRRMGERLREGFDGLSRHHGIAIRQNRAPCRCRRSCSTTMPIAARGSPSARPPSPPASTSIRPTTCFSRSPTRSATSIARSKPPMRVSAPCGASGPSPPRDAERGRLTTAAVLFWKKEPKKLSPHKDKVMTDVMPDFSRGAAYMNGQYVPMSEAKIQWATGVSSTPT